MAVLLSRPLLAILLGLAVGRIAIADTFDLPQTGSAATSAGNLVFSQLPSSPQAVPPLRLALSLNKEKLRAATKSGEPIQEPAIRLAEQGRTDDAPPGIKTNASVGDAARIWEISPSDKTLNTTLARWSAAAGWQLVWDMEIDYPIETRTVLEGTFQEAVATVAQSLTIASVPVQATFYEGNKVLRIVAKGSK